MAEQDTGMGSMMGRQLLHTHRSFVTHVFDKHQNEVLRVSAYLPVPFTVLVIRVMPNLCSFTVRSLGSTRAYAYMTL